MSVSHALRREVIRLAPARLLEKLSERRRDLGARKRMLGAEEQLVSEAERVSSLCLPDLPAGAELRGAQERLRSEFLEMIGLLPAPDRGELRARIVGRSVEAEYVLERITLETLPGVTVTANLYLPRQRNRLAPCVLYQCGHMPGRLGAKAAYRGRYLWYPRNGFACLALDPMGFGEAPGVHHGLSSLGFWHWLSLGFSPAGLEVWNGMRALDYLQTRPEVDASRIGATGISGGGVMTWYLAAADERIRVAAPSCSTYTVGTQARARLVRYQCDCTFFPNWRRWDLSMLGALIAPRPILLTGGARDPIFPPAGYRVAAERLKATYSALDPAVGASRVATVWGPGGHDDSPKFLEATWAWMSKWLEPEQQAEVQGSGAVVATIRATTVVTCLETSEEKLLNAGAAEAFAANLARRSRMVAGDWRRDAVELRKALTSSVFAWFSPRAGLPAVRDEREFCGWATEYSEVRTVALETEDGVWVRVIRLRPKEGAPTVGKVVVVRSAEEGWQFPDLEPLLPILGMTDVAILYPRFTEVALSPSRRSEIERTAALTGRTIAALQTWDVMEVVRWLESEQEGKGAPMVLLGRGPAAVPATYGCLLGAHGAGLVVWDPPSSHRQGPPILGVLRITDIEEVLAALGPDVRRVVTGAAPDRTAGSGVDGDTARRPAELQRSAPSVANAIWSLLMQRAGMRTLEGDSCEGR